MDRERALARLTGCYVTVPTPFRDDDLEIDFSALRRHVRFLLEGGIREGTGCLLACGAAGDFSTMTFEERLKVTEAVVDEAAGRVAVAMGAMSTSTRELVRLARAAESLGADYIQISPPFYFSHTPDDFYEYVLAAHEAADVGLIVYNTFWTSTNISVELCDRVAELPGVIGLKWAAPEVGFMEFERVITRMAHRLCVIDNQLQFVISHILGARGIEVHVCNYWPEWGVRIWKFLEERCYREVQEEIVRVAMPFYVLWKEMERYTGGDGYLDKLCMELVGLYSSRCRPPTRDVRPHFREKARRMLEQCRVPRVESSAMLPVSDKSVAL